MEEVYNPYTNQAPYAPPPGYVPQPAGAPAGAPAAPITAAGQEQGQPWPPQAPPQPTPQPTPQPGYAPPQAGYAPPGGYGQQAPPQAQQASQITKLATQSGQPVGGMNLVIIEGFINSPKVTDMGGGNVRLGFFMVWEMQVWENGQPKRDPYGNIEVRNVRYLCQAWGDVAKNLAQLPEGLPIKLFGMLNRWNAARNDQQPNWITDVKATRYELL